MTNDILKLAEQCFADYTSEHRQTYSFFATGRDSEAPRGCADFSS